MSSAQTLTTVMYHYVRPLVGSAYPRILGLELEKFERQLDFLLKHFSIISVKDLLRSIKEAKPLPENPAILSFDDGYKDHFRYAAPALAKRNISGVFFPISSAVMDRDLLDVNKIHFTLANVADASVLVSEVERLAHGEPDVSISALRAQHFNANRFDSPEVSYLKRLLQFALPVGLRAEICNQLFAKYVSADQRQFADDLYLSLDDLKRMRSQGLEIGSHGHRHFWLDRLSPVEQDADIDRSLEMLTQVGIPKEGFYFCYPYGSYNEATIQVLKNKSCAYAVTTKVGLSSVDSSLKMLEMPRLDTNDVPCDIDGPLNAWAKLALAGGSLDAKRSL